MQKSKSTIVKYAATSVCMAFGFQLPFMAHAETQTLKATVEGKVFESDDDGITLVPVASSFSLSATTKGFSKYPPPTGLSDRLAIACRNFEGKAVKYTADDFAYGRCNASFVKGQSKQPFGKAEALFEVTRKSVSAKTFFDITKASGKMIEGHFMLEMVEEGGSRKVSAEGTFKAEDRQK